MIYCTRIEKSQNLKDLERQGKELELTRNGIRIERIVLCDTIQRIAVALTEGGELELVRDFEVKIVDTPKPPPPPPVDRTKKTTIGGTPIGEHEELKPNGQQKDYIILSDEERAKGFVRPVRRSYKHLKCGVITTMSHKIAETYARDPKFYGATFCTACSTHLPVGENGEFVWEGTDEKVGT